MHLMYIIPSCCLYIMSPFGGGGGGGGVCVCVTQQQIEMFLGYWCQPIVVPD
jgi:hypothetical protein